MIYPAQTSLIPVTVALAKWVEAHGFGGLYPYWYLGTTPVKYLIGPVVPSILVGLHKILPQSSYFDLSIYYLLFSIFFSSVGWGVLVWKLSGSRVMGVIGAVGVFLMPWHWVSALALSELSAVAAGALTPWVLWMFARYQEARGPARDSSSEGKGKEARIDMDVGVSVAARMGVGQRQTLNENETGSDNPKRQPNPNRHPNLNLTTIVPVAFAFALLLLTNAVASIPAVVGMGILSIFNFQFSIFNLRVEDRLKRLGLVILGGGLIATLWYGPGYWWTIATSPSIGGRPAVSAFVNLINLMRGFVPVILAVVLVFWGLRPKGVYQKFTYMWLSIFGLLTLFRFMADFDFWTDWTAWVGEVEVGLALLASTRISNVKFQITRGPVGSSSHSTSSVNSSSKHDRNHTFDLRALSGTPSAAATPRGVYPELVEGSYFLRWLPSLLDTKKTIYLLLFTIYLLVGWFLAYQHRDFWLPRTDIENTVEYRIAKWLEGNATGPVSRDSGGNWGSMGSLGKRSLVFLSGTTAFWLNSFVDIAQVRGGVDQASVDPSTGSGWRQAAWEIREGVITEGTERTLKALRINYIVVHTQASSEFYHDFVYSAIFEKAPYLQKVYDDAGDRIYKVTIDN